MAFIKFKIRDRNELEQGGRSHPALSADENEPSRDCPNCHKSIPESILFDANNVCSCGHHFRMSARHRIKMLCDRGRFEPLFEGIVSKDPLNFPGYEKKLDNARLSSGEEEAVLCGRASIGGQRCILFVMDPFFMMGSMGEAVGEKITRCFELATEENLGVVGITVSGGARMQEGLLSLMQMAKTSAAIRRHSDAGLFYLTLLTDPTTGGVTASFAMLGDIILAEPEATIGFAGARVVEQTTHRALPKGFQTSEFLLAHGFVDAIVPRAEQRALISRLLRWHRKETPRNERL